MGKWVFSDIVEDLLTGAIFLEGNLSICIKSWKYTHNLHSKNAPLKLYPKKCFKLLPLSCGIMSIPISVYAFLYFPELLQWIWTLNKKGKKTKFIIWGKFLLTYFAVFFFFFCLFVCFWAVKPHENKWSPCHCDISFPHFWNHILTFWRT